MTFQSDEGWDFKCILCFLRYLASDRIIAIRDSFPQGSFPQSSTFISSPFVSLPKEPDTSIPDKILAEEKETLKLTPYVI